MTSAESGRDTGIEHAETFTVTRSEGGGVMPGALTGVTCPRCRADHLLKDVIDEKACERCGARFELA